MYVENVWLEDALSDPQIGPRVRKLKLKAGHFETFQRECQREPQRWRSFIARGPRHGILGVLIADLEEGDDDLIPIGVYVDRKYRRQGVGTQLVHAAHQAYPSSTLLVKPWSANSENFFQSVEHMTYAYYQRTG